MTIDDLSFKIHLDSTEREVNSPHQIKLVNEDVTREVNMDIQHHLYMKSIVCMLKYIENICNLTSQGL